MLDLHSLPTEILYKIIAHSNCASAFSLRATDKFFQALCTNPSTYLEIVKDGNDFAIYGDETTPPRNLDWWPAELKDWRVAARWAFADMRAQQCMSSQLAPVKLDDLYWLPELAIAGHPQAQKGIIIREALNVETKLETFTRCVWYGSYHCLRKNVANIRPSRMQLTMVGPHLPLHLKYGEVNDWLKTFLHDPEYDLITCRALFIRRHFGGSSTRIPNPPLSAAVLYLARMAAGTALVGILYDSIQIELLHTTRTNLTSHDRSPPEKTDLPLKSLYPGQLMPLSRGPNVRFATRDAGNLSVTTFIKSHLPIMTSADFLVSQHWVGYYCYNVQSQSSAHFRWDPMMQDIRFRAQADYPDHCAITTIDRAYDGCGTFLLYGTVHKQSGMVQMTKQYDHGPTWAWSAVMTPFGIVGSWGEERWGGWLWLWPANWTDEHHLQDGKQ